MLNRKFTYILATTAMLFAASAASAQSDSSRESMVRDLTVEQNVIFTTQAPAVTQPGALNVVAWVDHHDNTYAIGESVRLFVKANKDSYITVMNVGASGRTTVLFPNQFQTANKVRANQIIEIPGPKSGSKITVSGPVGTELIKVIASTTPTPLFQASQLSGAGPFPTVSGDSRSIARDLQVTMETQETNQQWDDYNKVIKTVERRPQGLTPVTIVQPGATPVWASQAFGIQIATDKHVYRIGEQINVFVRAQESCYLTLINVGTTGEARVLFPNQVQQNNLISAGQAILLPGTAANVSITTMGPAGTESLIAVCSTDNQPIFTSGFNFAQTTFPIIGNVAAVSRDLSVVMNAPQRKVTQASVGFIVTQ